MSQSIHEKTGIQQVSYFMFDNRCYYYSLHSHRSSQVRARCNTRDIDTDTNYAYDKEVYQEMKPCGVDDQFQEDDYEEIHNIAKKAEDLD